MNNPKSEIRAWKAVAVGAIIAMLIGLPLSIWGYEYARLGISPRLLLKQVWGSIRPGRPGRASTLAAERRGPTVTPFFTPEPIGFRGPGRPMIGSVVIVDLDEDGAKDVIACDTTNDYVYWLRQENGRFRDIRLGSAIRDPIRAEVVDLDRDGDRDILVAVIGVLTPTNRKVGSVVLLRNEGSLRFTNEILLTGLRRTVDARTGDLDGDGDLDIVVAVFGHFQGEILWMENDGAMHFTVHQLLDRAGGTDTPIVDLDGDGDLDIVALVSQEFEEIWLFINDGAGNFERLRIFDSSNDDFGGAGIEVVDIDQDGDFDVVFTNGDAGDTRIDEPRPWHALQWLENRGHFRFRLHEILRIPGAYDSKTIDLDGDGDLDIALSNQFNDWKDPAAPSLVWMENQQFPFWKFCSNASAQKTRYWGKKRPAPSVLRRCDLKTGIADGERRRDAVHPARRRHRALASGGRGRGRHGRRRRRRPRHRGHARLSPVRSDGADYSLEK